MESSKERCDGTNLDPLQRLVHDTVEIWGLIEWLQFSSLNSLFQSKYHDRASCVRSRKRSRVFGH